MKKNSELLRTARLLAAPMTRMHIFHRCLSGGRDKGDGQRGSAWQKRETVNARETKRVSGGAEARGDGNRPGKRRCARTRVCAGDGSHTTCNIAARSAASASHTARCCRVRPRLVDVLRINAVFVLPLWIKHSITHLRTVPVRNTHTRGSPIRARAFHRTHERRARERAMRKGVRVPRSYLHSHLPLWLRQLLLPLLSPGSTLRSFFPVSLKRLFFLNIFLRLNRSLLFRSYRSCRRLSLVPRHFKKWIRSWLLKMTKSAFNLQQTFPMRKWQYEEPEEF